MTLIWVLCDDRAGNVNQALGVAQSLNLPFIQKDISYNALAKIPNFMLGVGFHTLTPQCRKTLTGPWPDLVISAGRRTAPIARAIKKKANHPVKLVQIMYPGQTGADDFDLIAIQDHDAMDLPANGLSITGAPHRLTEEKIAQAQTDWQDRFGALSRPRIALIIGGATKNKSFDKDEALSLCRKVNQLVTEKGGSLLVTTSRRTGALADLIFEELNAAKYTFKWGDSGENPYFGFLACADYIIVSGDSVSMCCEATMSPAPVHIFAPSDMISEKHKRFHQSLYSAGYAHVFEGTLYDEKGPRLNSAEKIAQVISKEILRL